MRKCFMFSYLFDFWIINVLGFSPQNSSRKQFLAPKSMFNAIMVILFQVNHSN